MKRDIATILVGILFLIAGIAIGGSMLGFFRISIDLDGWWTVFIIVPALITMVQGGINAGNIIMLGVGIILLLNAQHVLPPGFTWRLILPIALLAIGVQLLFGGVGRDPNGDDRHWRRNRRDDGPCGDSFGGETGKSGENGWKQGETSGNGREKTSGGGIFTEASRPGTSYKTASALFAGQDICYGSEDFTGGSYTAVFGGLTVNLCNVNLSGDVVIQASAFFGGIDLILPSGVKVVSNVTPVLGGADVKYPSSRDPNARTVIVNGVACFGGIDIK